MLITAFQPEPLSGAALNQATTDVPIPQSQPQAVAGPVQQDYYRPKEYDPATKVNPLQKPAGTLELLEALIRCGVDYAGFNCF